MKFAARAFLFLPLLVWALTGCETVSETLIVNETGTGSLILEWTLTEQQIADTAAPDPASQPIDRHVLGTSIDEAFGTKGYVLSDRVAFNELRGERTGFTITKPIRNLDDVRNLGGDNLESGRPPVMLWRDIELTETTDGSLGLIATPSVGDRQQFLGWNSVESRLSGADEMVFVASFAPRGQITSHNADEVDGNTLRWRIVGAEPRTMEVDWTPMAPDTQSALPFLAGLLVVIALCAIGLYLFDKRSLDRAVRDAAS